MSIRKYQIPESRLPFVNTEIAELNIHGNVRLISSIWGAGNGGRIYVINPQTGESFWRRLPEGIPGAYMLRTAEDGRLYLGCGEGSLVVYDPLADSFEVLVTGRLHGITWGGCVTGSYVVWSASPGYACVYDWQKKRLLKTFRPLDSEHPTALYAHAVEACPDGKVLLGVNVPQARLVLLDPATLTARSFTPDALRGRPYIQWISFMDNGRVAIMSEDELLVMNYPSLELERRIDSPDCARGGRYLHGRTCCFIGGTFYSLFKPNNGLWRLDLDVADAHWRSVVDELAGDLPAVVRAVENRYVCAIDISGEFIRYDTQTSRLFRRNLDSTGPATGTHALCIVPELCIAFGAQFINQRFWKIDLDSGRGRDMGQAAPGSGQINGMVWDEAARRLLMASYTSACITAFDPDIPPSWPKNPRVLARANNEQMRPKAFVHDGRFIWMASSAEYGLLGGAISRMDPASGEIKVWRNIVPNQTPISLVLDSSKRRLYLSTEIYADCNSTPATERAARLVAFNMDTQRVDRRQSVSEDAGTLRLLAMLPSGAVLGIEGKAGFTWRLTKGTLFTWNPADGTVVHAGEINGLLGHVTVGPDGKIYAVLDKQIGTLELEGGIVRFHPFLDTPLEQAGLLQIHGGTLYAIVNKEVWAIPLD